MTYNWKWLPNALGDTFDAGGPLVKSFGMWERQTLINKYQADFYHGDPTRSTLTLVRQDQRMEAPDAITMQGEANARPRRVWLSFCAA